MIHCLAFDLGASGGKIFAGGFDGQVLKIEEIRRFENRVVEDGGSLFWDLQKIHDEYIGGIKKAVYDYPTLRTVAADTFCNDFSFIDREGEVLLPIHTYRDPRTLRNEDAIYSVMSKRELYNISGNQIAPFNTLMQLAAMSLEGEGGFLRGPDKLLFLPDLLTFFLTGERYTERTIASVTQMYDHGEKDWSDEVLNRFGIDRSIFAPFTDAGEIIGEISSDVFDNTGVFRGSTAGVSHGTNHGTNHGISHGAMKKISVCSVPEHDTAAAFMASQADGKTITISSGTWMLVGCEVKKPVITDYGFEYNIANEGGIEGRHRLIRNLMGTWILQEVIREFEDDGLKCDFAGIAEAAGKLDPWHCPFDVDHKPFYSPGDMRKKVRTVCLDKYGTAPDTPAEYAACICASLALKARWAMEKIGTLAGRGFERINIIGGGSRDFFTAQLISDVSGLPVVCGPAEASALGNIMFQLMALGEISCVAEGRELIGRSFQPARFEPRAADEAEAAYLRFIDTFRV